MKTTLEKLEEFWITEDEIAVIYHKKIKERVIEYLPVVCWILTEVMVDTNAEDMEFSCDLKNFNKHCKINVKVTDLFPKK